MKKIIFSSFLILLAASAHAQFYSTTLPSSPPSSEATQQTIEITLEPGSLKDNLMRIAGKEGWGQIIWAPTYDYVWPTQTTFMVNDLESALSQILAPYPLKALVYPHDRVIVIQPK